MSLSSAKAKLDAQGGDPATGYISKTDHKDSYTELVADTALTGATTAEAVAVSGTTDASSATTGTLKTAGGLGVAKKAYVGTDLAVGGALTVGTTVNGRDPDDLAKGAASSTDNALVRFDGTDGKTVQNSGITVDDSGNITSDVTVSKAAASINMDAAAGSATNFRWRAGGANRWAFIRNGVAESGSNAGSNFQMYKFTDGGTGSVNVEVTRSTGRWTFQDVGATAGLELGASGPRVMSGTGSPESVVTAPVGSTWTDTAATTGAIQWMKASGTGNTGWVVQYGDTGWRNLAAESMSNSWAVAGSTFGLRRVGQSVSIRAAFSAASASAGALYTLPTGFRPVGNEQWYVPDAASAARRCYIGSDGVITVVSYTTGNYYLSLTFTTTQAWPSSLPGT